MADSEIGLQSTITLEKYLNQVKCFIIPYYQRGYIWGKKRTNGDDSVSFISKTLIEGFRKSKKELFLQGVTVVDKNGTVTLIDGQQRTTYFTLLLAYLNSNSKINIKYEIRKESEDFLNTVSQLTSSELIGKCEETLKEKIQDIYYFKKTVRIIDSLFKDIDKEKFLNYLLKVVKFLYIRIPEDKATIVFSMMNGNKAQMTQEELIKAEILRLASIKKTASDAEKWEQILLRNKYAREWDRWIYWWNRKNVKFFYRVDSKNENLLGLLLETYFASKKNENKQEYSFESFRDKCLRSDNNVISAKSTFYELRHLQKRFEDVFNSIGDGKNLHNKIGAILCLLDDKDRKAFINKYFNHEIFHPDYIDSYYKYIFLKLTNYQIDKYLADPNNDEMKEEIQFATKSMIESISKRDLYNNEENDYAFLQLLRLNIDEDIKLNRAFDFSFWQRNRSLEHILPKSKVYYKDKDKEGKYFRGDGAELSLGEYNKMKNDKTCIDGNKFPKEVSEHCIGNLVLLHKNENSAFGNKTYNEKKQMYFEFNAPFNSRHLQHTVSIFSKNQWGINEIKENKEKIIKAIEEYYDCEN